MKYKGIEFEDYTIDTDNHIWANICQYCVTKNNIPNHLLDRDYGDSLCSVCGCQNPSEYYIDFPDIEVSATGSLMGYVPNVVQFSDEEKKYFNRSEKEYLKVRKEI